ncbi:MAG: FtsX-like permease family protein [Thermodesulfobacteriota bacterium]
MPGRIQTIPFLRTLSRMAGAAFWLFLLAALALPTAARADIHEDVAELASFGDRSPGSDGAAAAADMIRRRFMSLGFADVGTLRFILPVMTASPAGIALPDGREAPCRALFINAMSPPDTTPEGISGPVVWAGAGSPGEMNGKQVRGAIVLMDLNSGRNWLSAADLGAAALVYVAPEPFQNRLFSDKFELTPVSFPRFFMTEQDATALFGDFRNAGETVAARANLRCRAHWKAAVGEDVYCLIPGTDPDYEDELVILEAFYDSTVNVAGQSPGADEALSVATLLSLAGRFAKDPPKRSLLLLATAGHSQSLAGMREAVFALRARSKNLRDEEREQKKIQDAARKAVRLAGEISFPLQKEPEGFTALSDALVIAVKDRVDELSRELSRLRLSGKKQEVAGRIKELADERWLLRRILWKPDLQDLTPQEAAALNGLLPQVAEQARARQKDARDRLLNVKSAKAFRSLVAGRDVIASVSLHLSSQGDGMGAFHSGFLYPLKPVINRQASYPVVADVLSAAAAKTEEQGTSGGLRYHNALASRATSSWESLFLDRPALGGEVSALAGYMGVTFATTNDARAVWGTPEDRPERVDYVFASRQADMAEPMVRALCAAPELMCETLPQNGFSWVTARANFIRHGELFPDRPAPGTVIQAYQGPAVFYAIAGADGEFVIKGAADKKHSFHKVILEGYRFSEEGGDIVWAIDKKQTGKDAYRVKMLRHDMETSLIMFACRGTTVFNLLEPRSLRFMTRIQVLDGRTDALPLRYWYSRIDTWDSTMASFFLEPEARLKLTLSDTVLGKKLILTNASPGDPQGTGYPTKDFAEVAPTELHVANDMWDLVGPRIENLEAHGIYDGRVHGLMDMGKRALAKAEQALAAQRYDEFFEKVRESFALAARVYDHVDKTQKDVLFGVLFYIALFVPFAFCLERVLFGFSDINRRILAFLAILFCVIALIYKAHPAFGLAYSPLVVVLAFFIMGLSFLVSLIIFLRFEQEMEKLQKRQSDAREGMSRAAAFFAAFFLGVTNLKRRRLRTALTTMTLVILTFTIMSFTSVKTVRRHGLLHYADKAPYAGFLLKNANWSGMPPTSLSILENAFTGRGKCAARVWLTGSDRSRAVKVPLSAEGKTAEGAGLVGLSWDEPEVSHLDRTLVSGRWFLPEDQNAVIISQSMARELSLSEGDVGVKSVRLWGMPYLLRGIFSGKEYSEHRDLDGEPVTPVIFPSEAAAEMTEVEAEALESGEEISSLQSRYQHVPADQVVLVPARTALSLGGRLASLAVAPPRGTDLSGMARELTDRFAFTVFCGKEDGTFVVQASDALSYSGLPNIIIPIVISVFIVLNTMIGSVYERRKEIAVYTSVGLAPSHVSFLFIAEALSFGVLSVVLGYLLAQTLAYVFAGTSLWEGITVNYSSLSGVAAMVLVMLVVVVSTLYPSKVAADIAIPDVNRAWSMPVAQGDRVSLRLPFLVRGNEQLSLARHLQAWFSSHQDVTHASFCVDELRFSFLCPRLFNAGCPAATAGRIGTPDGCPHRGRCVALSCSAWLAPFDFGIRQDVETAFCPSPEDESFVEMELTIVRKAGEQGAWARINKTFVNGVRKQLLLWRSLTREQKRMLEDELVRQYGPDAGPEPPERQNL